MTETLSTAPLWNKLPSPRRSQPCPSARLDHSRCCRFRSIWSARSRASSERSEKAETSRPLPRKAVFVLRWISEADVDGRQVVAHLSGCGAALAAAHGDGQPELAGAVAAPALHGPVVEDRAGVAASRDDSHRSPCRPEVDGGQVVGHLAWSVAAQGGARHGTRATAVRPVPRSMAGGLSRISAGPAPCAGVSARQSGP